LLRFTDPFPFTRFKGLMVEVFDLWLRTLGAWVYPVLALAALVEYLFPPFPGDSVSLLGGASVALGERSWPLVLLALMAGSVVGILLNWRVGLAIGARVERLPEGRLMPGVTHAQVRRAQELMRTRGALLLVVNRFLPSFRAVLFIAAGASEMPLWRVLSLGTISALAWNGLLVAVGMALGDHADRIELFLRRYETFALSAFALICLGLLLRRALRAKAQSPK
jgi:membrane protein DedA with SNARE-associated domain